MVIESGIWKSSFYFVLALKHINVIGKTFLALLEDFGTHGSIDLVIKAT